ncbi:uncharacterized protein N7446_011791 [Penicillium canescens]|uniref:uncharacterized protein n=1 Tax=Penicillium canescens TaxID=5083 RepID=UPI0026DEB813|nr:uncharacterized protein N7446_011791 [Penicillium canescens]KAJ6049108.1 hypothetical protein N7446_011791 [Penicillium canescens]
MLVRRLNPSRGYWHSSSAGATIRTLPVAHRPIANGLTSPSSDTKTAGIHIAARPPNRDKSTAAYHTNNNNKILLLYTVSNPESPAPIVDTLHSPAGQLHKSCWTSSRCACTHNQHRWFHCRASCAKNSSSDNCCACNVRTRSEIAVCTISC